MNDKKMTNDKKSFILYLDAMRLIAYHPVEQRGWLITALTAFAWAAAEDPDADWESIADEYPEMTEECRGLFRFMCGSIARDTDKWYKQRETRIRRREEKLRQQAEEEQA